MRRRIGGGHAARYNPSMPVTPVVILASASSRRRELLAQMGVAFEVVVADVHEAPESGEEPLAYVQRVALAKADAVSARLGPARTRPVLGADTEVVVDGAILGKPASRESGLAMLASLSGRSHEVLSAVALMDGARRIVRASRSVVTFRATTATEREHYWATGEPADKAGGYAVQGRGAVFIERLEGSYSGVMGLPIFETAELLREFGIEVL
jgi:septum formation protein